MDAASTASCNDVASAIVTVEDSDAAESSVGFGGERCRDDRGNGVLCLTLETILTFDKRDHRLAVRIVRLVTASLAQNHFRRADYARGRAIIE